jgi:D-alanine-D-alanine ligase
MNRSPRKTEIALLFGGDSAERIISERSAETVARHLPKEKYNVARVRVDGSAWTVETSDGRRIPVDKNRFGFADGDRFVVFDCAFVIIHGTPGENGLLQAYFEMMSVPFTTCGSFVSAMTFDKYVCKSMLRDTLGVALAPDCLIKAGEPFDAEAIAEAGRKIGYPMFVKPNAGGSSFGITKVVAPDGLAEAVEKARREGGGDAIVEAFVAGAEFSHGIYTTGRRTVEFPVTQIVSENEFFDFDAKYGGKSREITPAPIADDLSGKIRATTRAIVSRLSCRGLTRIDYILSGDTLYFLEINTVPGMSEASIVPQQIAAAGLTLSRVLDLLVEDSIAEAHEKQRSAVTR